MPAVIVLTAVAAVALAGAGYLFALRDDDPFASKPSPTQPAEPKPLIAEAVPFVSDRARAQIRDEYMPAADHKALAISTGPIGIATGQSDEKTATTAALTSCKNRIEAAGLSRRCELYAVGDTVVFARGSPPLPPPPWVVRDASIERPFSASEVPFVTDRIRQLFRKRYFPGMAPKALAVSAGGAYYYYMRQRSSEEAVRRTLEVCGGRAGVPCLLIALDDVFIVPLPTSMKPAGLFNINNLPAIAPEWRADVVRRLSHASGGWSALAAGAGGRPGLTTRAASEQAAIDGAVADCARHDHNCRVIAIGPFTVAPK
jgi:adenylate cyclase